MASFHRLEVGSLVLERPYCCGWLYECSLQYALHAIQSCLSFSDPVFREIFLALSLLLAGLV
jgi:hypothetical protein